MRVFIYWFVFKLLLANDAENYSAYVFCGFMPWLYFQLALLDAGTSVRAQYHLMRKVYFPREALPISLVLSNLIHFLLALAVLFVYFAYLPVKVQQSWMWLPAVILLQTCLVLGLSFIVSCLYVFYYDVKYIVAFGLDVLFFLTPIVYFFEQSHARLAELHPALETLYLLNPMALLVMIYRKILLPFPAGHPAADYELPGWTYAYLITLSLGAMVGGYAFFNKYKWRFVERA